MLRPVKRRINQLLGRDLRIPVQLRRPTIRLGTEYGGWVVCPDLINPKSIIYSFGVGDDISFDREMIRRFGVTVHAFDPTPKAKIWLSTQEVPEKFILHEVGLAEYDGMAYFSPPLPADVSFTFMGRTPGGPEVIQCQVQRLSTIMRSLEHDRLEVLKMDIEGAEYGALRDLLECSIPARQVLVEFQHKAGDQPSLATTRQAVEMMQAANYKIFAISSTGLEYSFLKT